MSRTKRYVPDWVVARIGMAIVEALTGQELVHLTYSEAKGLIVEFGHIKKSIPQWERDYGSLYNGGKYISFLRQMESRGIKRDDYYLEGRRYRRDTRADEQYSIREGLAEYYAQQEYTPQELEWEVIDCSSEDVLAREFAEYFEQRLEEEREAA